MQTLSDIVAAVVVSSSTAAFSHFGVTLEPPKVERPAPERTVNRTAPAPKAKTSIAAPVQPIEGPPKPTRA
ncbi:MAG TPA: hypothetical protein VEA79_07190 [Phenylobacterium sp.]|nr:hypothetical protein [Phenylobacterium sp.]